MLNATKGLARQHMPGFRDLQDSNHQLDFEPVQNFTNRICYAAAFDYLHLIAGLGKELLVLGRTRKNQADGWYLFSGANQKRTTITSRNETRIRRGGWFNQKLVLEEGGLPGAIITDPDVEVDRKDAAFCITRAAPTLPDCFSDLHVSLRHVTLDCTD